LTAREKEKRRRNKKGGVILFFTFYFWRKLFTIQPLFFSYFDMKNLFTQTFLVAICSLALTYYIVPWTALWINIPELGSDYKLGLDLQGGIELDYKIDLSQAEKEEDYNQARKTSIVEWLKGIIDKRVETLNINDSTITSASYGQEEHIIVQIPLKGNSSFENSENIERAKEAIGKVVKIEFRETRNTLTDADYALRKTIYKDAYKTLSTSEYGFFVDAKRVQDSYENVISGNTVNLLEVFTLSGTTDIKWMTLGSGFSIPDIETTTKDGEKWYLLFEYDTENKSYDYLFISANPSPWKAATDKNGRVLNDSYFVKSSVQYNEAFQPLVELTFNSEGAKIFWELTSRLVGKPIAIFVGGELLTAPTVNQAILDGKAVITGQNTPEEAVELSTNINTGVVPAAIYLTSERTIDSRLGLDSLSSLIVAGFFGFVFILIFLMFTYRLSGIISAVALFVYAVILLALLKVFGVVLTLATIAGLILSLGMAIDANILIFERTKDELNKWKNLKEAVKVGFRESFTAIWDSHITGFIVASILFIFGINMIKGFWLVLGIGMVVSLFTVYFVSRIFLELLAEYGVSEKRFIGNK
jgi:protein-export membrane protein SecD